MDPIGDSHGFPRDVLPPEGEFSSREELVTAINAWAAPRGYAFISQRSFYQLANAGIAPKEIRSYLRTTSDTLATQQDIYNCIARGKRDLAKGQSNIYALANQLNSKGFWSEIRLDEGGRVTAVLFAHPQSLEYLKLYPEVLLLDFDLFKAWRITKLVLLNQLSELKANQAKQQITTPLDISGVLYGNIRGWISHEALRKVNGQRARLLKEIPACIGVFAKTLSLPCAHNLQPLLAQGLPLQLYHFYSHWHL
ncbi:hypothetical protein ACKAV7_011806 [Fusarium commune]